MGEKNENDKQNLNEQYFSLLSAVVGGLCLTRLTKRKENKNEDTIFTLTDTMLALARALTQQTAWTSAMRLFHSFLHRSS